MKPLLFLFFLVVVHSCSNKSAEQRYTEYINDPDHKITQLITIGGVRTTMKYLPYEYRKLINPVNDSMNYHYFNIKMEKAAGDKLLKQQLLYLDFDLQKDFVLLAGNDSIPAAICQKIENGRSGSYEYLLAFDKVQDKKDFTVFYHDKVFGLGTIAFVYNNADLKKIPALNNQANR